MWNKFFQKGYKNDAAIDVILQKDITILPHQTQIIDLGTPIPVRKGYMAMIVSRTSAAKKGIIMGMSPIDPEYTGNIHGIIHNVSSDMIRFEKGESFCQIVYLKFSKLKIKDIKIRKSGKRNSGNFGSSNVIKEVKVNDAV